MPYALPLKNFGRFEYIDKDADDAVRQVDVIYPHALGNLIQIKNIYSRPPKVRINRLQMPS